MRKYKEALFQEHREAKGSYRNYRFRIGYINHYIDDHRCVRKAFRYHRDDLKVMPAYYMVYSVGYVRLKPCDGYLLNQAALGAYKYPFNCLVDVPGIDISYDETDNRYTGKGRWIGFALNSFHNTYIEPMSYIDAIKYVKKVIDKLIELRGGK